MRVSSKIVAASGDIPPSWTDTSCRAICSMQFKRPSTPAKSIFFTRERSTTTQGTSFPILFFNSRHNFRASFPPKISGSLTIIADGLSISPSSDPAMGAGNNPPTTTCLASLQMLIVNTRFTNIELLSLYPVAPSVKMAMQPTEKAPMWRQLGADRLQQLPDSCPGEITCYG